MITGRIIRAGGIVAASTALLCLGAWGQDAQSPDAQGPDTQVREAKGMPPRATPNDYQAHAQAGAYTIAAEFKGHSVATPQSIFTNEDYVVIEVGLFGPPDAHLKLSSEDFTLRVNATLRTAKKPPLSAQPFALVFKALKDPEWEPPSKDESKGGKTKFGSGGDQGGGNDPPPAPAKMPFELVRAMDQKVQKASLPEGDRALPTAGLIYFQYGGKTAGIRSIDLTYSGPAGKATLALQP